MVFHGVVNKFVYHIFIIFISVGYVCSSWCYHHPACVGDNNSYTHVSGFISICFFKVGSQEYGKFSLLMCRYGADRSTVLCNYLTLLLLSTLNFFNISFLFILIIFTQLLLCDQKFCQSWSIIINVHPHSITGMHHYCCLYLCPRVCSHQQLQVGKTASLSNILEISVGPTPTFLLEAMSVYWNSYLSGLWNTLYP